MSDFNFDQVTADQILAVLRESARGALLEEAVAVVTFHTAQVVASQLDAELADLGVRLAAAEAQKAELDAELARLEAEFAPAPSGAMRGNAKERELTLAAAAERVDAARLGLVSIRRQASRRAGLQAALLGQPVPDLATLRLILAALEGKNDGNPTSAS